LIRLVCSPCLCRFDYIIILILMTAIIAIKIVITRYFDKAGMLSVSV
jgi:hypothetical protein